MTNVQPDLFNQSPVEPEPFDAAEVAERIAATARPNPYVEQEARAARIAEQRDGISVPRDTTEATADLPEPGKPFGHEAFEPLKPEAAKSGLPAVRALRKSIKR